LTIKAASIICTIIIIILNIRQEVQQIIHAMHSAAAACDKSSVSCSSAIFVDQRQSRGYGGKHAAEAQQPQPPNISTLALKVISTP
jgi:hypothetical protein